MSAIIITAARRLFAILAVLCYIVIFLLLCITVPMIAGYRPTIILSASMEPTIMTGNIVYSKQVDEFEDLKKGDIITFHTDQDSMLITHRIVQIDQDTQTIKTKGDGNDTEDMWDLQFRNVDGKAAGFQIPKAGTFILYLKQPVAIGLAVFIIVMNFIFGTVGEKYVKNDENRDKKDHSA